MQPRLPTLTILLLLAGGGGARPAAGQTWVPPQPPCDVTPGHFRVTTGQVDLKLAAEKQAQHDRMLAQAHEVIARAITDDKQDKNPGAWYYLGRYFTEVGDALGADSAFARAETLAPQCKADITTYRRALATTTYNRGAAAWQAGNRDSAATFFHLAYRVLPSGPRPLFALAALYADGQDLDSATVYYKRAADAAVGDTSLAGNRRDALANVARIALTRVQSDPAMQRAQRIRASLDSLERAVAADSTVLDRMGASSAARHKRQAHLSPADQQAFARDSATRAEAVARSRAGRPVLAQQAAEAAAAVRTVSGPAVQALSDLLAAHPDADAAANLASLYAQGGEPDRASAVFDTLLAHGHGTQAEELIIAGERLLGSGFLRPGARALALGVEKNPYRRDALYYLATAYYSLRDSANTLPTAQRLAGLDPLNRSALRLVAAGWDLKGRRDSTLTYLVRADSGLAVDIAVASFAPDSAGFVLTAIATNLRATPSQPLHLSFDFLSPGGQVATTLPVLVPGLPPGENHQFELHVKGTDLLGWRYRPQ